MRGFNRNNVEWIMDDGDAWRHRAEEVRTIADNMRHDVAKDVMLRIAKDYVRLAEIADQRAAQRQKFKASV